MSYIKTNRDELLKNAFRLFLQMNYEKASYANLTQATGISKAGMSYYYPTKQELFIAVVDKFLFNLHNPLTKFAQCDGTLDEFIGHFVKGVKNTMEMIVGLVGKKSSGEQPSANADYFHFLTQVAQYYPNAQEKMRVFADREYALWRIAIQQAIANGELKADTDVEGAVMLFRQVYFGLSYEMSFFGGLDTVLLERHLRYIYSLLKA